MTENTVPTAPAAEIAATSPAATPSAPAAPAVELIDIDHFAKVSLRVGKVLNVEAVPKSKKLLKLEVDMGSELGKRQILSGISQFYTPDQLIGKKVVIVANLKPAQLMGLESQGMLLAGQSPDGNVIVIEPSESLPEGSEIR